jgi:hypothetical protein
MKTHLNALALSLCASLASAQSFNLDVGAQQSHPLAAPSYGAAANQPGQWFGVGTTAQNPVTLTDVQGTPTSVTITPTGGNGDFAVNNPTWSGDDDLLMEDATDVGGTWQGAPSGSITWTIANLAPGTYEIYTYALAPDFPVAYRTRVNVVGAPEGAQVVGGNWLGSPHVLGVSHARHTLVVAQGQTVTIVTDDPGTPSMNLATVNGFQFKQTSLGPTGTLYCFGDGTATACPCGNASAPGANAGCLNSLGTGGALTATGSASLSNDTITLLGSGMPSANALYFQGTGQQNGGLGVVFGDGLRCAGGMTTRLVTRTNVSGASQYPLAGEPALSVRGQVLAPGARTYQVWYRNSAAFCTPDGWNLTNALQLDWQP